MKHFEVPSGYRSTLISAIKNKRKEEDKLKKDFAITTKTLRGVSLASN